MINTSPSLTDWIKQISSSKSSGLVTEDIEKSHRLEVLSKLLGVEYDQPQIFTAAELLEPSVRFASLLREKGNVLCALKLIPDDPQYSKLRIKGKSLLIAYKWLKRQTIIPEHYSVEVKPYTTHPSWSASFIVNHHGVSGEVVTGRRQVLTTGIYGKRKPLSFYFDFSQLQIDSKNRAIKEFVQTSIATVHVSAKRKQRILINRLDSQFHKDYLSGYFETTFSKEFGFWLVDYNRVLGELYKNFHGSQSLRETTLEKLSGRTANPGKVIGRARVVTVKNVSNISLEADEILICPITTPDHLVLMSQAKAIVTDLGSILSHASVIAREMGKPCIVATNIATHMFKNGDLLEIDADRGLITKIPGP